MILDAALPPTPLKDVPAIAESADALGFGALWSSETMHDPFLPGALVAEHTKRLHFGTSVAIAFARSPANLAYMAWDLAEMSGGRFILGLGTQVKAHIERRFGMPWPDSVVGKLREQILAVRAFWLAWQTGEPLIFRGDYYRLNLMSPFFNPGPIRSPQIPIYIAGVNKGLARLSGELADGFLVHPLHSSCYLEQVILPAVEAGAAKHGRSLEDVSISASAFVVTTPEEEILVRSQIAFYASTRSYRPVMALHGWGDVASELSGLAARRKWSDMPGLIDDEMLRTFALDSPATDLHLHLQDKYAGLVDRLSLYIPFNPGEKDDFWRQLIQGIREREPTIT
jgi:probable F420-dependent oxidoreductase